MKKFCKHSIFFLLPLFICFFCYSFYLFKSGEYEKTATGSEVYSSIRNSKKKVYVKKLIIGDSTAFQFFNDQDGSDLFSLACNQAISLCGHYILLNNFLSAGNRPKDVYLVYMPFSFCNNLDEKYTYGYFLKPFFKDEYIPLMTEQVLEQISQIPYYEISQFPLVLTSSWVPSYKSREREYTFLSPISCEYLRKMEELSTKYSFNLYIVPSLISEIQRERINEIDITEFNKEKYADKLFIYLNNILYVDNSLFRDGVHLKQPSLFYSVMKEKMKNLKKEYIKAGIK